MIRTKAQGLMPQGEAKRTMRAWQRCLVTALVGLVPLAEAARAGEHVDWLDDGTVLLKLGPACDNAVIETSRDQLGSLFSGPDAHPFAGATVRVLSQDEGRTARSPARSRPSVFEELSGAKVELRLEPVTNVYSTMMLDWRRGTGQYDATVGAAFFYGELISADLIRPVDDLLASGKYPRWSYDAMPDAIRQLYTWDGKGYGVLNDADGQVLYYRRDVLSDPGWQAKFKEAVGYDLPVPPKTWQQVLDIAHFFDGKNFDPDDSQPDHGMVMHLKPGEQGHFHFQSLAAAFAIDPAAKGDQAHNVFWFDPETMKPLINDPGHVAALDMLLALEETGPGEQLGWRLPDAWSYFLRGKAVFMFTFGDLGPLCEDAGLLARARQVRRRHAAGLDPALGPRRRQVGRHAGPAAGRQHHRGHLAGPDLQEREAARGGVRLPLAHGHAAGLAVERGARLDRRQRRLQVPSSRPRPGPRSSSTTSRPAGTRRTFRTISRPTMPPSPRR